jgi:hypothetical protein
MIGMRSVVQSVHRFVSHVLERHTRTVMAMLAVCASALALLVLVALPWRAEAGGFHPRLGTGVHLPQRICELARLTGDTLLAGACWPSTCVVAERR